MSVTFFKKKTLTVTKRICLLLKEAREAKGLSLEDMVGKTKISKQHLKALEECRFRDLPTAVVYQKNFVRAYVEALDLNPAPFLSQYLEEEKVKFKIKHPHRMIRQKWFGNLPSLLRFGAVILVMLVVGVYLGFQIKRIIEPPKLILYSPPEGYIAEVPSVLVQGETDREVRVYLNGQEIKNNEQGQFKELIDLSLGVNTIVITVEKKHGKKTSETRHVVLKEKKDIMVDK